MRKFQVSKRLPMLISMLALLGLSIGTAVSFADNVQVNDLSTGGNVTKDPGDSGTATLRVVANSAPSGDVNNCNVSSSSPATVTLSSDQSWVTFPSGATAEVTACGNSGAKQVAYSVSSTAPAAGVATISTSTSRGVSGSLYNEDSFTVTINGVAPPADTTPPTISITSPLDGDVFTLNQAVNAAYSCDDEVGGSGLASCVGDVPNGEPLDTSSVGAKTFTVNAEDNAGNPNSQTNNYSVVYDFDGFFQPVDNGGVFNVAKAGSSIPVKFSLSGDQGLNILAAGSPKSERVNCDATSPSDALETLTAGNSSLSYNATADQYNYVWKTDKAWAGTCRKLTVTLDDGTSHTANFKFTK